jgi:hypothetical protein
VHLRGLTKLDELYLDGTEVTGECLRDLDKIKSLRVLRLNDTRVSGQPLVRLQQMPKLEVVILVGTPITKTDLPFLDGVFRGLRTHVVFDHPLNKFRDQAVQEASNNYGTRDPSTTPRSRN